MAIGSHILKYNGPTLLHQEHFPKEVIGLDTAISSHMCIYDGPTLLHR